MAGVGPLSAAERLIRDAVADSLRRQLPQARIVHELVCGSRRADLAAVERDRLLLVEIKSEKDDLTRCDAQMRAFAECGHAALLAAHEKWFDRTPYSNGLLRLAWPSDRVRHDHIWCCPEPPPGDPGSMYRWTLPRPTLHQPRAATILDLLWRAELMDECARHRVSCSPRSNRDDLITQMAWLMTGREIAQAVCRQLRARSFPEADPAIHDAVERAA